MPSTNFLNQQNPILNQQNPTDDNDEINIEQKEQTVYIHKIYFMT